MVHNVFISYSNKDKSVADAICSILEQNEICCWIAPRNITPGVPFSEAIIDGIKESKVFVLVYSSNSNNSTQVIREVDRAVHNGQSIINFRLEDVPLSKQLEYYISSVHWLDAMTSPLEQHIQQLCSVVQMFLKPEDAKDVEIAEALRKGIIKQKEPDGIIKGPRKTKRRIILALGFLLAVAIAILSLIIFNIGSIKKAREGGSIGSIIVLPFSNYTGQDTLDWFVSGMHSSLIQEMGKIGSLHIPGTTTSQVFKDSKKTIKEITSELKVDAALEMAVLCLGNDSICFQTRLIKPGREEERVWIADYKIARNQILNWYTGVTKQIAKDINIELTSEEERLLAKSRTVDRETYDAYLKWHSLLGDGSKESLYKALEYLNSAVEKDPDWAPLYSRLASVWTSIYQMNIEPLEIAGPNIFANLKKALELDPDLAEAHSLNALVAFLIEWNWEKAEKEYLKAIAINPNDAGSRAIYAQLLCCLQRPDEAILQGRLAIELDPLNPLIQVWYSVPLMNIGDYKTALAYGEKITAGDPGSLMANSLIEAAAFYCRDYNKVMEATKYVLADTKVDFKEIERIFGETGFVAAQEEILRQLEALAQKGYVAVISMVIRYMMVDQPEKAIEWIEKGFEVHAPSIPYIATHGFLCEPLFGNPRFIAVLKKMNLPLPKSD